MPPARQIWTLRHADAIEAPPEGGTDRDRMLSPAGTKQATRLGEAIAAGELPGPTPSLVLVSSATRTRGTAMLVFSGLDPRCDFQVEPRIYEAGPDELIALLRELPDDAQSVGIVGHNPAIAWLSIELADESEAAHPAREGHPPASLSVLELELDRWSELAPGTARLLAFHLTPLG